MNDKNLKKVVKIVFDADDTEPPSCQGCQDMLYAYIDSELGLASVSNGWPDVKAHLDQCSPCQQTYEEMKTLLLLEHQGQLIEPPVEAHFDFSYLPKPAQPRKQIWDVVSEAGKEVVKLFTNVRVVLGQGIAFFEELPNPLVPSWEVAPMPSRRNAQRRREPVLPIRIPEADLLLRLRVTPATSNEAHATLIVKIEHLSSSQPATRCRVTLRDIKSRILESNLTDEEGHVKLTNLEPDNYLVEIKFKQKAYHVPIIMKSQEVDMR